MGRFENVSKVQPGDTKTAVTIDMRGYVPRTGRSGHLDEGNFEFEVAKGTAKWTAKRDREGRNLEFTAKSVGPAGSEGVPIVRRQPAPDDGDPKQVGEDMLKQLIWAVYAHMGKLDALMAAGPRKYAPEFFESKRFYASVRDGEGEFAGSSEYERYLSAEEYKASPGPRTRRTSPVQRSIPEIAPQNGGGTAASVDALLGLTQQGDAGGEAPI